MRLLVLGSVIPKIGSRTSSWRRLTSRLPRAFRSEGQVVPAPREVEAEVVFGGGRGRRAGARDEDGLQPAKQAFGRVPVQVPQDPVVRKDPHLVVGEGHREEARALAGAVARLEHARRGGAAVVAIGDVEALEPRERRGEGPDVVRVRDAPRGVADAVGGGEVHGGRVLGEAVDVGVDFRIGAVGEEDGAGLGVERFDVADAVVLLVGPGELVFADDAVDVFLATGGGDAADLGMGSHDLPVEVVAGLGVLVDGAVLEEALEVLGALRVNGGRIGVCALREVDLRFAHAEEAEGVAGGDGGGFLGGHDVVGQLANPGGEFGAGQKRGERSERGHV
jgi:hypothetical protein